MFKYEALVEYAETGKARHVFNAESKVDAEKRLFDIMDYLGYDVISYQIERIAQPKGESL